LVGKDAKAVEYVVLLSLQQHIMEIADRMVEG
jgi:hypothetical protein